MYFQEFGVRSGKPNIIFYTPVCLLSLNFYQELYYFDNGEEESGALCDQV